MVQYSFRKSGAVVSFFEPEFPEHLQPTTNTTPRSFHTFPTELRIVIFREYLRHYLLQENLEKFTPPLIKALRPEPQLYHEALEIFYSLKLCSISPHNEAQIMRLPRSVLGRLTFVKLWYGPRLTKEGSIVGISACLKNVLSRLRSPNLRSVYLATKVDTLAGDQGSKLKQLRQLVKNVILELPSLVRLTLEIPKSTCRWKLNITQNGFTDDPTAFLVEPTCYIDVSTQIRHKYIECDRSGSLSLYWDTGTGRTLTWTDYEYCRSVPRQNSGYISSILTVPDEMIFHREHHLYFIGLTPRRLSTSCAKNESSDDRTGTDGFMSRYQVPPELLGPQRPRRDRHGVLQIPVRRVTDNNGQLIGIVWR